MKFYQHTVWNICFYSINIGKWIFPLDRYGWYIYMKALYGRNTVEIKMSEKIITYWRNNTRTFQFYKCNIIYFSENVDLRVRSHIWESKTFLNRIFKEKKIYLADNYYCKHMYLCIYAYVLGFTHIFKVSRAHFWWDFFMMSEFMYVYKWTRQPPIYAFDWTTFGEFTCKSSD